MKLKSLLTFFALGSALVGNAQLGSDGYYRVNNYMSGRYIYVIDDKGQIDYGATSVDLRSIELWRSLDKAVSDPATVLYIHGVNSTEFDITGQGTGINKIIGYYVKIRKATDGTETYFAYGTNSGMTKYLGDGEMADMDRGTLSDATTGTWRQWYITPISANSANYFGVMPNVSVGGSHYASFFAEFPFSFYSDGMTAYYVTSVDSQYGIAVYKEVDGGKVPYATPVFIKCGGASPADNKLNVGDGPSATQAGNMLSGVYFKNPSKLHYNQIAYNPATMRVLGLTSGGELGFVTESYSYLPRNIAYLTVPEGTPSELALMTQEEYDQFIYNAGIDDVTTDGQPYDIYNLSGVKVRENVTSFEGLPAGLYIAKGRKVAID